MKTVFKIYSVVVLLGSISCIGSDDMGDSARKTVFYRLYTLAQMSPDGQGVMRTYSLIHSETEAFLQGYGIVQIEISNHINCDRSYHIMYEPRVAKVDDVADKRKTYQGTFDPQKVILGPYKTLSQAQIALQNSWKSKHP